MNNIIRLLGKALYAPGELDACHEFYPVQHEIAERSKCSHQLLIDPKQIVPPEAKSFYNIPEMSRPQSDSLTAYSEVELEAEIEAEIRKRTAQLKDEFLNTVSHELRTPLSTIKMAIQVLERVLQPSHEPLKQDDSQNESKVKQCLTILREECDREITLINDLLALQQLEADLHPLLPTAIQLQAWIPEIVESFQQTLQDQQQTLQVKVPDNLPPLISEISMFIAILRELLTNACKFSPQGSTITVTARAVRSLPPFTESFSPGLTDSFESISSAQKIQITVSNSGVEIPEVNLPHVFDKFYRVPSSDRWKQGGTGLGLALLKKRVEYLGGLVWAKSYAGETHFTVELPNLIMVDPKTMG